MLKRLLQATTITFLLSLLAQVSQPDANQPMVEASSPIAPKLLIGLR